MTAFVSLDGCGNFAHLDAMSADELCAAVGAMHERDAQDERELAAKLSPRVLEVGKPFTIADLHYIFYGGSLPLKEYEDAMVADFFALHPEFRVDVSPAKVEHSHKISMRSGGVQKATSRSKRKSRPPVYLRENYYRKW